MTGFFLLYGNTSFFTYFPKLGKNDYYLYDYSRANNDGVKDHDEVTRVKM